MFLLRRCLYVCYCVIVGLKIHATTATPAKFDDDDGTGSTDKAATARRTPAYTTARRCPGRQPSPGAGSQRDEAEKAYSGSTPEDSSPRPEGISGVHHREPHQSATEPHTLGIRESYPRRTGQAHAPLTVKQPNGTIHIPEQCQPVLQTLKHGS